MTRRLADSGLIEFLNVIHTSQHTDPKITDVIPTQGMMSAPHFDFTDNFRKATGLSTIDAARITEVVKTRYAIASGLLHIVRMTRAHMADPHFVQNIIVIGEHDIRPCVGTTYCLDRIYQGEKPFAFTTPQPGVN